MKYNQLGTSELQLSEFSLGTSIYGEGAAKGVSEMDAIDLIHFYLDMGGNHIDTADVYADGLAEEIIGKAIKNKRGKVVISTKVGFSYNRQIHEHGLKAAHIIHSVEKSLRRLQTDYIDIFYLHLWDADTPLEESLRAIEDLIASGKVVHCGIANFKAWQVMKALQIATINSWSPVVAGQYQYSLVKRDIEYEFPDLLLSEKIGLVVWGALGGGFLSGKYHSGGKPTKGRLATAYSAAEYSWERRSTPRNWEIMCTIDEIDKRRNVTCAQISLAWLKSQKFVTSILLGARTRDQLRENLAAVEINLDDDEIKILNAVSRPPELYPYRFVEQFGRQNG